MLTAIEAKEKCLQMWRRIAEKVTDKEWREKVRTDTGYSHIEDEMLKIYAFSELFGKGDYDGEPVPNSYCFLCEYHRIQSPMGWSGCADCSLGYGEYGYGLVPCMTGRRPYASFIRNVDNGRWVRAAKDARRLIAQVEAWQVE